LRAKTSSKIILIKVKITLRLLVDPVIGPFHVSEGGRVLEGSVESGRNGAVAVDVVPQVEARLVVGPDGKGRHFGICLRRERHLQKRSNTFSLEQSALRQIKK